MDDILVLLQDSLRDYVTREKDLPRYREIMGAAPGYNPQHLEQMKSLGWQAATIAEAHGGSGMGLREAALMARELGAGLLGDVYIATSVMPAALLQHPLAAPAARPWLERMATESTVLALAWQESAGSLEPNPSSTQARKTATGHVISGTKRWVAGGAAAQAFLVAACVEGQLGVVAIPRSAPGLSVETAWQVDGQALSTVRLEDVEVDAGAWVCAGGVGLAAVTHALEIGRIVASAELIGVMNAAFEMTLEYMKTRVQYGKRIGSFQALQHKAVDLLVQRELAEAVLEEAILAADGGATDDEMSRLASRCKARCSDAALRITRECIQLHGAIGYTHEYDLGLYVKRALALSAWLGNAAQHRRRHASWNLQGGADGNE